MNIQVADREIKERKRTKITQNINAQVGIYVDGVYVGRILGLSLSILTFYSDISLCISQFCTGTKWAAITAATDCVSRCT